MQISKNFQVYRSSAGSGKTFALTKNYLNLVLRNGNPTYFRHILAITFTVKASHEMKGRIMTCLAAFSKSDESKSDMMLMKSLVCDEIGLSPAEVTTRSRVILNRILQHYGDLSIMTIDKFVHGLVRSFSADLGLSSDFNVEIDLQQLIDRASEELFDLVGRDEDLTKIILAFVNHQMDQSKSWNISNAVESLCYLLTSENFYLNAKSFASLDWQKTKEIITYIDKVIKAQTEAVKQIGDAALSESEKLGLEANHFYYSKSGIYGYFAKAKDGDLEGVYSPNTRVLTTIESEKWASKIKAENLETIIPSWAEKFHQLIDNRDKISRAILFKKIRGQIFRMALIGSIRHIFTQVKEGENLQLLSDFYQLLDDRFADESTPYIFERLGQKFRHVLIDEFQDTSALQWQNLIPLVENCLANGDSTLLVGDAKQSIYRFRGSESKQFVELPKVDRESKLLFEAEFSEHILDTNYRSAKAIVEFNNRFFSQLCQQELPEKLAGTYADVKQKSTLNDAGHASIQLIKTEGSDDPFNEYFLAINQRISLILKEGAFTQKDICILFRTNAEAAKMASSLIESGFSVSSEESLLLANNPPVMLLMQTLDCVQNPNKLFNAQKWLSKAHQSGLVLNKYHSIALRVQKEKWSFWQLLDYLKININKDRQVKSAFSALHQYADVFGLNLNDPFIEKLFDFALSYDDSSMRYRMSYIDYWMAHSEKMSIAPPSNIDAIQIMTIHKSKGLEFPVVFVYLPEMKTNRFTQEYQWVANEQELPYLDQVLLDVSKLKQTSHEELYENEHDKTKLDLINSMYVAFTRGSRRLEIFIKGKDQSKSTQAGLKPASKELEFLQSWPEWDNEASNLIVED